MGKYLDLARSVPYREPERKGAAAPVPTPSDVPAFLAARCCRSPRVWCEADRMHGAYRYWGGRLDQALFGAAVLTAAPAVLGPAGLVVGVGLVEDWPTEDGGTLRRERRGGAPGGQ